VSCQEKDCIIELLHGHPDEKRRVEIVRHLGECDQCRREFLLAAATSGLALASEAGPDCLDNETLCALYDGALPEQQQGVALEHLAGCGHCLDALINLDRALAGAAAEPVEAPRELTRRLAGATGPSLWQRLRAGLLSMRFVAATASAAAAFLAVYFLARPPAEPTLEQPTPRSGPSPLAEAEAEGNQAAPAEPAPASDELPAAETVAETGHPAAPAPGPEKTAPPLLDAKILAKLLPSTPETDRPPLGATALDTRRSDNSPWQQSYRLGRVIATSLIASGRGKPGKSNDDIIRTGLLLLARWLEGAGEESLAGFAGDLAEQLQAGRLDRIKLQARLEVLDQALRQKQSGEPSRAWFYDTGKLVTDIGLQASLARSGAKHLVDPSLPRRCRQQAAAALELRRPGKKVILRLAGQLSTLGRQLGQLPTSRDQLAATLNKIDQAVDSTATASPGNEKSR